MPRPPQMAGKGEKRPRRHVRSPLPPRRAAYDPPAARKGPPISVRMLVGVGRRPAVETSVGRDGLTDSFSGFSSPLDLGVDGTTPFEPTPRWSSSKAFELPSPVIFLRHHQTIDQDLRSIRPNTVATNHLISTAALNRLSGELSSHHINQPDLGTNLNARS